MVKLVGGVAACGGACFSEVFVRFRLFLLLVQFHLNWAFDVVAEFSALVLGESFC